MVIGQSAIQQPTVRCRGVTYTVRIYSTPTNTRTSVPSRSELNPLFTDLVGQEPALQIAQSQQLPPRLPSTMPSTSCKHNYVPYARELKALYCSHCSHRKRTVNNITYYNKRRREFRRSQNLLATVARLDQNSCNFITRLRSFCGIYSNTANIHVTLVDGLRGQVPILMRNLYYSVLSNPSLIISHAFCVKTMQKTKKLVCLELEPKSTQLRSALKQLSSHEICILPQWELHVALGTVPTTQEKHVLSRMSTLEGLSVNLDLRSLLLLASNRQAAENACPTNTEAFTLPVIEPSYRPPPRRATLGFNQHTPALSVTTTTS